jgi:hypothetical protein
MKDVTLKDTKNVIYDAYEEVSEAYEDALKKIKTLENSKVSPEKQIAEKVKKETFKTAEEVIGLGILNPEIIEKKKALDTAIEMETEELDTIYKIKVEANTLTALVNANIDKRLELEKKDKENEESYRKRLTDREADYREAEKKLQESFDAKSKDLKKNYEETETNLKVQRVRDEETYKYDLKRDRKIENDKWADEKALREKCLADRELEVSEREEKMAEMEATIAELKAKVDEIPALVEKAKKDGEETKTKELERVHAIKEASTKRDAEWEKKILDQKVDSLTKELDKVTDKATGLEAKLNDAYKEITGIAEKTVQSSGVRIIETNSKNEK